MKISETLYVAVRKEWRSWLKANAKEKSEIWLVYYKKGSGKPRIPYNDAVEEALCFGWIDSILKPIDEEKYAQRFSPRKPGSRLSAMNRERIRRLVRSKKMTAAGLKAVQHAIKEPAAEVSFVLPPDICAALKADKKAWINFRKFPKSYKRIRVGWIEEARHRPAIFRQRLNYFVVMTVKNQRFGMVQ
ncbi:MAG: YdeI/OmpD-associated family protein [Ignavibacteriales bacterium]|nr:YdeI/OmpD-associated family protein [Ignavibacteriales bacterium]